jgi:hypothetical protein
MNAAHFITGCFAVYARVVNKLKHPVVNDFGNIFLCGCVLLTPGFLYSISNIKSPFRTRVLYG